MSIAERVRTIREAHGHSIRDAEQRTGISRGTLLRIEQGCPMRTLDAWLRQFADAYGVPVEELLDGQTPKALFEWRMRRAERSARLCLLMSTTQTRVKLVWDFLADQFPGHVDLQRLAWATELPLHETEAALRTWRVSQPDLTTARKIAKALHGLTGISLWWMRHGFFEAERGWQSDLPTQIPKQGVTAQKARPATSATVVKELSAVLLRLPPLTQVTPVE